MSTRSIDPARSSVYWQKSQRYRQAAESAAAQKQWDPAVSAAVHSAISAIDAVVVCGLSKRWAGPAHEEVLGLLSQIPSFPAKDRGRLVQYASALLAVKNVAEYEDRLMSGPEAAAALEHLARCLRIAEAWLSAQG